MMNLSDAVRQSIEIGLRDAEADRFASKDDILPILDGYAHEMIKGLMRHGSQFGWNIITDAESQYINDRLKNGDSDIDEILAELGKSKILKLRFTMNVYNQLIDLNHPDGISPTDLSSIFFIMHGGWPRSPEEAVIPDVFFSGDGKADVFYRTTGNAIEVLSFSASVSRSLLAADD